MRRIPALLTLFLLVSACSPAEPVAEAPADPPDYTVVEKLGLRGGDGASARGFYLTIMLFGAERETVVSRDCYDRAQLGERLPLNCRR